MQNFNLNVSLSVSLIISMRTSKKENLRINTKINKHVLYTHYKSAFTLRSNVVSKDDVLSGVNGGCGDRGSVGCCGCASGKAP